MYLSKKHKLLFIAVPRTASNSVQRVLMDSGIIDSSDIVRSLGPKGNWDRINAYHTKPSELINEGVLTPAELSEYTAFGFVREPFERWVSSIFLARYTGVLDKSEDAFTQMCGLVRNNQSPRPFAQTGKPFQQPNYKAFSYRNFFFHGDTQVIDAYRFEDVEAVTNDILSNITGSSVTATFPHIQMNADGVPEQFRQPIASWLPSDCYEKMQAYFADEIAFYNSIDYFSV